jgi:hypothetical protein
MSAGLENAKAGAILMNMRKSEEEVPKNPVWAEKSGLEDLKKAETLITSLRAQVGVLTEEKLCAQSENKQNRDKIVMLQNEIERLSVCSPSQQPELKETIEFENAEDLAFLTAVLKREAKSIPTFRNLLAQLLASPSFPVFC